MNEPQREHPGSSPWQWLDLNWQYAGVVAGLFYLANLPLLDRSGGLPALLLWLQVPVYMAHQFEEYLHDRFRRYVNLEVGHGLPVLSHRAVTVINVGSVWGIDLLAVYLARSGWPGGALLAFYLAIVNAIIHIAAAIGSRSYNPGLVTAAGLLLPMGIWGAILYSRAHGLSWGDHGIAIVLIVALHGAIVAHVLRRRVQLSRSA